MPYVVYDIYHIHLAGGIVIKMIEWEDLPREKCFPSMYRNARPNDILNIRDFDENIHMVLRKNILDVVLTTECYEGPRPSFDSGK